MNRAEWKGSSAAIESCGKSSVICSIMRGSSRRIVPAPLKSPATRTAFTRGSVSTSARRPSSGTTQSPMRPRSSSTSALFSKPNSAFDSRRSSSRGSPSIHFARAEELRALAKWMEGLPREELLRLSNAEFGFEKSALVEELRGLIGDWVVPELGRLALVETDPLVKAVLVAGLFKGAGTIRLDDPRMIEQITELLPQLSIAADDPFHSARFMMFAAFGTCLRQQADFAALVLPHLEASDNPDVLVRGYLFLGDTAGADDVLARAVTDHPSAEGRFGALEGLRSAGLAGRIPPDEIAHLGIEALARETEARNRTLLVEMIASAGGEAGLAALRS